MSEKSRTRHVKFLYTQISVRIQTLSKKFTNENIQGNSWRLHIKKTLHNFIKKFPHMTQKYVYMRHETVIKSTLISSIKWKLL